MARMIKMLTNYLWINDWGYLGFHDGEFTFSSFQGTSTFLSPFFHLLHFLLLDNLFCQIRIPSPARLFSGSILVLCRLLSFAPPPSAVRRWLDAGTPGSQSRGEGGGVGGDNAVVCAVHLINRQLLKNSLWPVQCAYCHPLAQSSCPACHYKPSQLAGPASSIFNSPSFSQSKNPYWPSERTSHIDILTLHGPVLSGLPCKAINC